MDIGFVRLWLDAILILLLKKRIIFKPWSSLLWWNLSNECLTYSQKSFTLAASEFYYFSNNKNFEMPVQILVSQELFYDMLPRIPFCRQYSLRISQRLMKNLKSDIWRLKWKFGDERSNRDSLRVKTFVWYVNTFQNFPSQKKHEIRSLLWWGCYE